MTTAGSFYMAMTPWANGPMYTQLTYPMVQRSEDVTKADRFF